MPNESGLKYQISISELDKILELCQCALDGLSQASQMTTANRQSVQDAVANTCELIDTILTTVKQRLSDINRAIIVGDPAAPNMIADLNNASAWEDNYRSFHLCEPLRNAAGEIREGLLGQLIGFFSFKNPNELKATIESFLSAEEAAGIFVSQLLDKLTDLAAIVDTDQAAVAKQIQAARQQIQHYRDQFIELEKKVRAAV